MGSFVVVESGGNPALRVVTIRTGSLAGFGELASVSVLVTVLTNLGRALELHFLGTDGNLVTGAALYRAMRAKQRKFRLGMVEAIHVGPRAGIVAGFAAERVAVSAALRHAVIEFAFVGILVAASAGHVVPAERQDLVGPAGGAGFVTFVATYGGVSADKRIARLAVHGDGVSGSVEVADRVAVFAAVLMGRGGELAVVLILVAIQAGGKLDFVNRILARG